MSRSVALLEEGLEKLFSDPRYRPMNQHELAGLLQTRGTERRRLRLALRRLERRGTAVRLRKNRWGKPAPGREITGRLVIRPGGYGFVIAEDSSGEDLFIPGVRRYAALHGDLVLASVHAPEGGRVEGRIVRVLQREREQLVGRLVRSRFHASVVPDHPGLLHPVRLREAPGTPPLPPSPRKVLVRLDPWTDPGKTLTGTLVEDLGPADGPEADLLSLLRDRGLDESFPPDAEREAAGYPTDPDAQSLSGRLDLRGQTVLSIDPEDARDVDDALSISRLPGGGWRLGVHIADVSHYVAPGSAMDREARQRGNSVYLTDRFLPMLPKRLTSAVCSLAEGRDRLTVSVFLSLDARGETLDTHIVRSVIRSAARLDYGRVQEWMRGREEAVSSENVRAALVDLNHLSRTLRAGRRARGALTFALPETKCLLDERGAVRSFCLRAENEAYALVEECMLAANKAVARRLALSGRGSIYRVHDAPSEAQWARMGRALLDLGVAGAPSSAAELTRLYDDIAETPLAYPAALCMLRHLPRAEYSARNGPHFGLAESCYTHFTSPIRRYADLTVHRHLQALEEGRPPPCDAGELAALAARCSERERGAEEAEQESLAIKRIAYYEAALRRGEAGPYCAMVIGLTARGPLLELADSLQRGVLLLPRAGSSRRERLPRRKARAKNEDWRPGQCLSVSLHRIHASRRAMLFKPAGERNQPPSTPSRRRRRPVSGSGKSA